MKSINDIDLLGVDQVVKKRPHCHFRISSVSDKIMYLFSNIFKTNIE